MRLRSIGHFSLVLVLVIGFLAHMWGQVNKFFSGLTTVGVSYEERATIKFPTFAFCDSRAYKIRIPFAATKEKYNATAYDIDSEVVIGGVTLLDDQETMMPANHTARIFPTTYNGLCKSFEFHETHKVRSYAGTVSIFCAPWGSTHLQ